MASTNTWASPAHRPAGVIVYDSNCDPPTSVCNRLQEQRGENSFIINTLCDGIMISAPKEVAQIGAVIGREFPHHLAAAISHRPEDELAQALERLVGSELIFRTGRPPEASYTFKHALVQDAAYDSLLLTRRRALHGAIVAELERRHEDNIGEIVELLAHHALSGELWEQAVRYLNEAGAKAYARTACLESIAHYNNALTALENLPASRERGEQAIDIRLELRNPYFQLGDIDSGLRLLREGERLAGALPDDRRRGRALAYMSNQIWMTGATQQALALAKEALTLGEATADRELIIAASYYLGAAALTVGDYPQIKDAFKKMFEWLPEGPQERFSLTGYPGVIAHGYLSWGDADCGHFDEAIVHGKLGLRKAEEIGHAYSRIWARFGLATTYGLQGEHEAGLELIEQAMEIANAAGVGAWPMMLDYKRGHLCARAGRVPEGIALLRNSLEKFESVGVGVMNALRTANLGEALLAGGQTGEARAAVDKALALARDQQECGHEAYALRLDAELLARETPGDFTKAEARYREAIGLAERLGMRPQVAHCHQGLGVLYRAAGRAEAAQSHLDTASTLYRDMGMNFWLEDLAHNLN